MSYYNDQHQQWPTAAGQQVWDQPTPPARSGASSAVPRDDSTAFSSQLEEVERAIENLYKSGKIFNMPVRRDNMPMGAAPGRVYPEFGMGAGGPPRHHSVDGFSDSRSYSGSNLQNFYATQRHQPSRASEAEQVMQAKRRMAAQRERELRNYHQEQQYNRSVLAELSTFGGKQPGGGSGGDRTISPGSGMSEDERRDLIARQRSALYGEPSFPGDGSSAFSDDARSVSAQGATPTGSAGGAQRRSPIGFSSQQGPNGNDGAAEQGQGQSQQPTQQQDARAENSTSSPSSAQGPPGANYNSSVVDQSSRTSTSSPGGSPPRQGKPTQGVAPIGTRPSQSASQGGAGPVGLTKQRSTTPLPSPLSFGYNAGGEEGAGGASGKQGERSASGSGPSGATQEGQQQQQLGGWGNKSGVWGKGALGVQASVWG